MKLPAILTLVFTIAQPAYSQSFEEKTERVITGFKEQAWRRGAPGQISRDASDKIRLRMYTPEILKWARILAARGDVLFITQDAYQIYVHFESREAAKVARSNGLLPPTLGGFPIRTRVGLPDQD